MSYQKLDSLYTNYKYFKSISYSTRKIELQNYSKIQKNGVAIIFNVF